jgi:hypothetical protein
MLGLSVLLSATLLSGAAHSDAATTSAIPAWARRYNVSCSHCHLGANPTLNATGIRFRWAGYRMPDDIGQKEDTKRVADYLAARAKFRYTYAKVSGEDATDDGFSLDETNVYIGGSFAKNFGSFIEFTGDAEGFNAEIVSVVTIWGNEKSSHGLRFGQQNAYFQAGVAGFDRPIGLTAPFALDGPVTATSEFALSGTPDGVEGFLVNGSNRIALSVYSSQFAGTMTKDVGLNDQFLLDDKGSAIEVLGYYGTQQGLDPIEPTLDTHMWRLGITANKVIGGPDKNLMILGSYVYGNDVDLPASFPSSTNKGYAYWFSAQYLFPSPALTLFSRYEFLDPSTTTSDDAHGYFVFGGVLPIDELQYLKLTAEYVNDSPQGTDPTASAFVLEAQLAL